MCTFTSSETNTNKMKFKFLITWTANNLQLTHNAKTLSAAKKWAKEYQDGDFTIRQLSKYPCVE